MLGDLTPDQLALAEYMSDLSEQAYCAGWMLGLEFALWQVVLGNRRNYGRLVFTAKHRDRLRQLSASCGGWIIFDDDRRETWVSRQEWDRRFTEWLTTSAAKRIDG